MAVGEFGVLAKIIQLVKECNFNKICKVKYGKQISESFEVTTGRRQGNALPLTLFNLALEKVVISVSQEMDLLGNDKLLAFADDIMVIGVTRTEINTKTVDLIMGAKSIGLEINQDKTKYMVMGRKIGNIPNLIVDSYTFQTVTYFKYLGTNINNTYDMHNKIKLRTLADNKGYFAWEK